MSNPGNGNGRFGNPILDPGKLSKTYELDYSDAIKELCKLTDLKCLK